MHRAGARALRRRGGGGEMPKQKRAPWRRPKTTVPSLPVHTPSPDLENVSAVYADGEELPVPEFPRPASDGGLAASGR